jgi:Holliday junction DNA helicase RuvA
VIASLKGLLESVGEDWAVIDVGGVGYQVFCSARTRAALPSLGEAVQLKVETHVREDHIHLYGFADAPERHWFGALTKVQGVGARVALAILSVLGPSELAAAIAAGDKAALGRASGVGPKLAQRIATELKDRPGVLEFATVPGAGAVAPADEDGEDARRLGEAVSALVNLGYGRTEAFAAVTAASREKGSDTPLEALIRAGLGRLGAAA